MADLSLKIKADFAQAQRAFVELAGESKNAAEKIAAFNAKMKEDSEDSFIARQKMLGIALTATRGDVEALTAQQQNYTREMERLLKAGIDPAAPAFQKLQTELDETNQKLQKHGVYSKEAQAGMDMIKKGAMAAAAAMAAFVAAIAATVQKTAEAGDKYAKTARVIGMTAESFQELEYAANMSGVETSTLTGSLEKLNKNMGDVKTGTGALTTYLAENNKELLEQLKGVNSNEEAFTLLMGAIEEAPDEFSRAALAQAAFGKSGQELILIAEAGAAGIEGLKEEAREYGLISNESAAASEEFMDAQARLKQAFAGVGNELSEGMIPVVTEMVNKFAGFIAGIDDWEGKIKTLAIVLGTVTVALTAMSVVSKVAAGIGAVTKAFTALKAAMTAGLGPIGLSVAAIGGLIALYAKMTQTIDYASTAGEEFAQNMDKSATEANTLLEEWKNLNGQKAIDEQTSTRLLALYPGLADKMDVNAASATELMEAIKELNKEQAANAAQEWITRLGRLQESLREDEAAYQANINANRAWVNETNGSAERLQHWRSQVANAVEQANAILGTVGQRLGAGNQIIDIPVVITPPSSGDTKTVIAEVDDLGKTLSDSLGGVAEKQEAIAKLQEQFNRTLAITNSLAELGLIDKAKEEQQILQAQETWINGLVELRAAYSGIPAEAGRLAEVNQLLADGIPALEGQRAAVEQLIEAERTRTEEEIRLSAERQAAQEAEWIALNGTLQQKLEIIGQTEAQANQERMTQFSQFLKARLDAEDLEGQARLDYVEANSAEMMDNLELTEDERVALEEATADLLREIDEKLTESAKAEAEKRKQAILGALQATFDAASAFADLTLDMEQANLDARTERLTAQAEADKERIDAEVLGEEEAARQKEEIDKNLNAEIARIEKEAQARAYSAAVANKAIAHAEAGINTYAAAVTAFKNGGGFPLGAIAMAATIAMGLAQQAKIANTPLSLPTAETGGSFIVPDVSPRVDGIGLRVNAGERIDVTPAGRAGDGGLTVHNVLMLDRRVLFEAVNEGITSGEIKIDMVANL
jgi:hypothetical protein